MIFINIEMPKNCGECLFCHTENFKQWCCPTGREDIFYDAIPEWCPLEKSRTGEWIEEDEYGDLWVCDQCGFASEYKDNFCSNCGADMRGEENE